MSSGYSSGGFGDWLSDQPAVVRYILVIAINAAFVVGVIWVLFSIHSMGQTSRDAAETPPPAVDVRTASRDLGAQLLERTPVEAYRTPSLETTGEAEPAEAAVISEPAGEADSEPDIELASEPAEEDVFAAAEPAASGGPGPLDEFEPPADLGFEPEPVEAAPETETAIDEAASDTDMEAEREPAIEPVVVAAARTPAPRLAPAVGSQAGPVVPDASFSGDPIAVSPIGQFSPQLPSGVRLTGQPLNVELQFSVNQDGDAGDFSAADPLAHDAAVFAAAIRALQEARFPQPTPQQGGSYRGVYTVRFQPPRVLASLDSQPAVAVSRTPPPRIAEPVGDARPVWVRELTAQDFEEAFPDRALERGRSGAVELRCYIRENGQLSCWTLSESPPNWGFARAAHDLASRLIASPILRDGRGAPGGELTLPFEFSTTE